MRKVQAQNPDAGGGGADDQIHYEGVPLIGSHTLCGTTDIPGSDHQLVNKRVNCRACIAVRNHVIGRAEGRSNG